MGNKHAWNRERGSDKAYSCLALCNDLHRVDSVHE